MAIFRAKNTLLRRIIVTVNIVCYRGPTPNHKSTARELGLTMADLASKLYISKPAVSMSARRGERIASENGYSLMDE
jgi:hypothetical protein